MTERSGAAVLEFAAGELRRYVTRVTGETPAVRTDLIAGRPRLVMGQGHPTTSVSLEVRDPLFDDAFAISMCGLDGVIAGSNPRSVLIGTYRYLEQLGVRWLAPGPAGEVVPRAPLPSHPVELLERPTYRHRAMCIEGAVARRHLVAMLDFLPKLGFNGYFLQFMDGDGGLYSERWTRSSGIDDPGPTTLYELARGEMARRGLIAHAGGHGWTSGALGLPEFVAEPLRPDDRVALGLPPAGSMDIQLTERTRSLVALIGGRRILWRSAPSNTNLCYSSPEARAAYVARVVEHAVLHPDVDVLHLWLADEFDNHCECERCARLRPTDFYVDLLNEVDEAFTSRGIAMRVACLAYLDLLWAPLESRLRHPERFLFTFAPITRTFTAPLEREQPDTEPLEFRRNAIRLPRTSAQHDALLRAWQATCRSDSFTYEYHWYRNQYHDPATIHTVEVLHRDVQALANRGLNGFISCQSPRSAFPTGLGLVLLGRTLWDASVTFEDIRDGYLADAFGEGAGDVARYLALADAAMPLRYLSGEGTDGGALKVAGRTFQKFLATFVPFAERRIHESQHDPARHAAWSTMRAAAGLHGRISRIIADRIEGRVDDGIASWKELRGTLLAGPRAIVDALDTFLLVRELDPILGGLQEPPRPRLEA